jgi:hypothetical protein
MKKEIEINEWIEAYLNGDLAEGEAGNFRKHLEEDPSFAREVERHRVIRALITDGAYLDVKNELRSIHHRKTMIKKRIRRITGFGTAGLVIGTLTFLVLNRVFNTKENPVQKVPFGIISTDSVQGPKPEIHEDHQDLKKPPVAGIPVTATGKPGSLTEEADKTDTAAAAISGMKFQPAEPASDRKTIHMAEIPVPKTVAGHKPNHVDKDSLSKTDCSNVNIEGYFTEHESCNNKPTGSIIIDRQSVQGGLPPYTFSLSQAGFRDTLIFSGLYPGSYALYAKDANDCVCRLGIALIHSVDCTYQAVFAPLRGETWMIPAEPDRTGILNIFSRTGALVYTIQLSGNDTPAWNGTTLSGQPLPMGVYQFEIRYDDGSSMVGNVTIVR